MELWGACRWSEDRAGARSARAYPSLPRPSPGRGQFRLFDDLTSGAGWARHAAEALSLLWLSLV